MQFIRAVVADDPVHNWYIVRISIKYRPMPHELYMPINKYMTNSWARSGIRNILEETYESQGWTIPKPIIDYQTAILEQFVAQPNWRPQPSYAEQYMTLRSPEAARELGNVCWFTRAVFPELMRRRGIPESYYVDLGQSCYDMAVRYTRQPVLEQFRQHFEFLAECAHTAIRYNGEFRSMWD